MDKLDAFTRKHSENVASLTCRLCEYLHCNKGFTEYCTICAYLHDIGRAQYIPVTDDEAVAAFEYLAKTEGIICAIESAHAVAYARKLVPTMKKDDVVIICLSGRGDKDVAAIARYRGGGSS